MFQPRRKKESFEDMSDESLRKLESDILGGGLKKHLALQLLRFYLQQKQYMKVKILLDRLFSNGFRERNLIEFALSYYLHLRNYPMAYRYAEILCYEFDRQGPALLQLAHLALIRGNLGFAVNWANEFVAENPHRNGAHYLLGRCSLRLGNYRDALASFRSEWGPDFSNATIDWLSDIVDRGRRPPKRNWYGRKHPLLTKLQSIDWRNNILHRKLSFQANSLADIDIWINSGQYMTDQRLFGEAEFWQMPADFEQNRIGDCEDFALWVWVQLIRMNYNARFVMGGQFSTRMNHAWVCFYDRRGAFVFECTPEGNNVPVPAKNAREYFPIFSLDRNLIGYKH